MRLNYVLGFLCCVTIILAATWSPEDYEIFKLKDKLDEDLGKGTTFYSWLNLKNGPKSTYDEINKAYRKKSKLLHPDKFHKAKKSVKKLAEERFQRLSLIGNILRDQSLKKRYDYFLDNGFPQWRGTGYFYSRFRPTMVMTFVFLFVIVSIFHYFSVKIGRKQDFKRIVLIKEEVKKAAWNGSLIPPVDGSDRRLTHPTGKDIIVHSTGEVSIIEVLEDGSSVHHKLDENDIKVELGFRDTLFFKFPVFVYNLTFGRAFGAISTEPKIVKPVEEDKPISKKKSKTKGEKLELPNGKVIYGRNNAKKRK